MAAKPLLPCGIGRDVGPVVIEQVHLDVALARTAQERELVGPQGWVLEGYVRASSQVPLAGGIRRTRGSPGERFRWRRGQPRNRDGSARVVPNRHRERPRSGSSAEPVDRDLWVVACMRISIALLPTLLRVTLSGAFWNPSHLLDGLANGVLAVTERGPARPGPPARSRGYDARSRKP